jgi:hypothetical protein
VYKISKLQYILQITWNINIKQNSHL